MMRDRRKITVQGIVQGVGFRPFVYGLASRLGLGGTVRNNTTGVVIEVEGEPACLDNFLRALVAEAPPLARIERICAEQEPVEHCTAFAIEPSEIRHETQVFIAADVATCTACLQEFNDPRDRRYHYPFLNCTNCGPRFTIVSAVPYDRERTTMARFPMCPACQAEYHDPGDRRFHAQPTACPSCGPRLWVADSQGAEIHADDPLRFISARVREGRIIAIKGLGGYHLACDGLQQNVVRELRRRKQREAKPLAVMVENLEAAQRLCAISAVEAGMLAAPRRPIVLLRKHPDCPIADAVAPRNRDLGVMLPYTPMHHRLIQQVAGPMVMTSGNLTEEPIAYEDDDAVRRLAGIAEYFLTHNRPIHTRCDDSVTRIVLNQEAPLRRSRGYAPLPIRLPMPCPTPILACGGHLKNTFCLAHGEYAFLSHHIGDLEDYRTYQAFVDSVEHFKQLFGISPQAVAYDLHPGYRSSQYALALQDLPRLAVQHHHAHIAACMAENGCQRPVIGVAWDGTGYGTDGRIWGGEFLLASYHGFERLAHLEEVRLPGGEQAIRQPWRMAAAYLQQVYGEAMADLDLALMHAIEPRTWQVLRQMLARGLNSPWTSSAGRLFDAVAALIGLRHEVQYEGQAAVELEMLADEHPAEGYSFSLADQHKPMVVQTGGVIRGVVDDLLSGEPVGRIAARFHTTLSGIIRAVCGRIREQTNLRQVALSGGVFQNTLLLTQAISGLQQDGFVVYSHKLVPPNDGGLCLGQVAVANAILAGGG
jgi:hydrogenase maturation protein HypF